ncbi:MAG: DUF4390 domain-containing protein [Candidatus Eisenbacteria bacterium]
MRALPSPALALTSRRARGALVLAAACLLSLAGRAEALDIRLGLPRMRGDSVWIDVRLSEPLAPRIRESLARGMPATLELRAELWHRRRGWFDRLEENVDAEIRIRYEVWNRTYRMDRRGAPPRFVGSLDSLQLALTRPLSLPVGRVHADTRGTRHFIVVSAVLRPLSVEDVAEVESWLSGEVETNRRAGIGLITQVPRALFDTVRNFAGFGDARARAVSNDFSVETVEDEP